MARRGRHAKQGPTSRAGAGYKGGGTPITNQMPNGPRSHSQKRSHPKRRG